MVRKMLAVMMALVFLVLMGAPAWVAAGQASSAGISVLDGDDSGEEPSGVAKIAKRYLDIVEENGTDSPIVIVITLGILAVLVGLVVLIWKSIRRYTRMLHAKYNYYIFNWLGLAIAGLSAVYCAVYYAAPSVVESWTFLRLIGADESSFSKGSVLVLNVLGMMSPLIIAYVIMAFVKMKNILHTLLVTLLVLGVVLLSGYLGMVVAIIVSVLLLLFVFAFVLSSSSSTYKCSKCGKVMSDSEALSHRC